MSTLTAYGKAYSLHLNVRGHCLRFIDLDKIAKTFEVPIYYEKLEDNLAGCFIAEEGRSAIVVNKKDPEFRQRFTIAHELGHFISYKLQDKEGSIFDERGALARHGNY